MGREVVVAVTNGKLDFARGNRSSMENLTDAAKKRVLIKIIGSKLQPCRSLNMNAANATPVRVSGDPHISQSRLSKCKSRKLQQQISLVSVSSDSTKANALKAAKKRNKTIGKEMAHEEHKLTMPNATTTRRGKLLKTSLIKAKPDQHR